MTETATSDVLASPHAFPASPHANPTSPPANPASPPTDPAPTIVADPALPVVAAAGATPTQNYRPRRVYTPLCKQIRDAGLFANVPNNDWLFFADTCTHSFVLCIDCRDRLRKFKSMEK